MSYDFFDEEEMIELRLTRAEFERLRGYVSGEYGNVPMDSIREQIEKKYVRLWKREHDQDAECADQECGHPYRRHFDTYEFMLPVGCKYCPCFTFKEQS